MVAGEMVNGGGNGMGKWLAGYGGLCLGVMIAAIV